MAEVLRVVFNKNLSLSLIFIPCGVSIKKKLSDFYTSLTKVKGRITGGVLYSRKYTLSSPSSPQLLVYFLLRRVFFEAVYKSIFEASIFTEVSGCGFCF